MRTMAPKLKSHVDTRYGGRNKYLAHFKKFLKLNRINAFLNLPCIEIFNTVLKKKGSFAQFSVLSKTKAPKLKSHIDMKYSVLEFLNSILEEHLESSLEEKL